MLTNRKKRILAITLATAFLFMAVSPALQVDAQVHTGIHVGPYIEKVVYQVISGQDQVIAALLAGTIDLHDGFINPSNLELVEDDPDITLQGNLRNGFGHIRINCRDYPLNYSGFRRAFALAYDKRAVQADIHLGYSQLHDSLVPYTFDRWCIEDDLEYHYYDADPVAGNAILDDLGFEVQADGYRTAPGGEPIDIEIIYGASVPEVGGGCAQLGVDALDSLHIRAHTLPQDFNTYTTTMDDHGSYDMIFYATIFYTDSIRYLAFDYWSELADVPLENPSNFANETYDLWRDQLLYSTSYEDVFEAGAEMQKILHYNVPLMICYENIYMQAYRNDVYEGHVPDRGRYIDGPWTVRNIKKIDGTFGGTVTISIGQEPDNFNYFVSQSGYTSRINNELYSRLYDFGPDLGPYPMLALGPPLIETHADNDAVPVGHHRFTVDIVQNATWSDGTQLTAEDMAFAYTYIVESAPFGNTAVLGLERLVSATAPTPYTLVVEFSQESFWNFVNFCYARALPKHIFNDETGLGYAAWDIWNPYLNPADPTLTSGPFKMTDFIHGDFYELSFDPNWYYYPENWPPPEPTTTPEPTETPTGFDPTLAIVAGAVGAAVVILVGGFVLLRQK